MTVTEKFQEDSEWHVVLINESLGLFRLLSDKHFCWLLFFAVLEIVNTVQSTTEEEYRSCSCVMFAVAAFKIWLQLWENRVFEQHEKLLSQAVQTELSQVLKEVCDPIVVHAEDRYSESDFPAATQLVNPELFKEYMLFSDYKLLK